MNKQRTFFLKGRNQFSSEVWRVVGLINCGYAEVGSSFQDILDTRSYVLCTKSEHFQTPPKAQRNIYIYIILHIHIYIYTHYLPASYSYLHDICNLYNIMMIYNENIYFFGHSSFFPMFSSLARPMIRTKATSTSAPPVPPVQVWRVPCWKNVGGIFGS